MANNRTIMMNYMKDIRKDPNRYYYLQNRLSEIIEQGIDVSTQGYAGNSLLHLSVILNNIGLVRMFIRFKVRLDLANHAGETPLHKAVIKGYIDIVKLLIKSGCDINCAGEMEQTPLHMAVISGNLEMVKCLVDSGADITRLDEINNLPIDYAIDEKDIVIIRYFLTKQDVDEKRAADIAIIDNGGKHVRRVKNVY